MLIIWVSTAVSVRYQMYFFTILKLLIVLFIANGVKTIQAIIHRQKANPIGGMPLAITIFTDQRKVANRANKTPLSGITH